MIIDELIQVKQKRLKYRGFIYFFHFSLDPQIYFIFRVKQKEKLKSHIKLNIHKMVLMT